jgi:ABC-2 type transport system ATP-binding protein
MVVAHVIETRDLRKVFNGTTAVANLNLTIDRGEVFGFLGPNGAGKTTAVKMLLGLVHPTAGDGYVFGLPVGSPAGRRRVGFLPEHFRFHDWLKAREFLQLHANLCKIPPSVSRKRIPELLELVQLTEDRDKKLRFFSKGMLQRIGLAQALLNDPALVFLDEPTSGLDPMGRRLVRDIIRDLKKRGTTVFLNSHLLSEVEITCDRVAFIKRGKIVYESTMEGLVKGDTTVRIEARLQERTPDQSGKAWASILSGLTQWGTILQSDGNVLTLSVKDTSVVPHINRYLVAHQLDVYSISPQRISLEELFMQVIEQGGDS